MADQRQVRHDRTERVADHDSCIGPDDTIEPGAHLLLQVWKLADDRQHVDGAGHNDALPLFLEALREASQVPLTSQRSITVGMVAGEVAKLDPAAARQVLAQLLEPVWSERASPSDVVRVAVGAVGHLESTGRTEEADEILGRALTVPGGARVVSVFLPDRSTDVPLVPSTHRELLERLRALVG